MTIIFPKPRSTAAAERQIEFLEAILAIANTVPIRPADSNTDSSPRNMLGGSGYSLEDDNNAIIHRDTIERRGLKIAA